MALIWAAFALFTVRHLWGLKRSSPREKLIFGGVKGVGLTTWLAFSLVLPAALPSEDVPYLRGVLIAAFLGLPLWLWLGWWAGLVLTKLLGISR